MSLRTPTFLCVVALGAAWSAMASAGANVPGAPEPSARKLPFQAIVNGHNLQPRDDQLKSLHIFDLTPEESQKVDRVYQQLEKLSGAPPSSLASQAAVGDWPPKAQDVLDGGASTAPVDWGLDDKLKICRGC